MRGIVSLLVFVAAVCSSNGKLFCESDEARAVAEKCRTTLLGSAHHNFTKDCEDGIVKNFMRCMDAVQGCTNISDFAEEAIYDHYGCMDSEIALQKRGWLCRVLCGVGCWYACSNGVCSFVCGRVCNNVCDWLGGLFGRDLSGLNSTTELTDEQRESMKEAENLCSNCMCIIDVKEPKEPEWMLPSEETQISKQSAAAVGTIASLSAVISLAAAAVSALF